MILLSRLCRISVLIQGVEAISDSKFLANVGAGIYYSTPAFYVGLSSPRLMDSDIDFEVNNLFTAREQAHYYLMTGVAVKLDHRMSFVPQVLVRYTKQHRLVWISTWAYAGEKITV